MNKGKCFICGVVVLLIFYGITNFTDITHEESKYCILLDLGSAGSRAYLMYIERDQKSVQVSLFPQGNSFLQKTKPGVSSFFPSPERAASSLFPLLDGAMRELKEHLGTLEDRKISLYAFATAGLRLLAENNNQNLFDDDEWDVNELIEEDDDTMATGLVTKYLLEIRDAISDKYSEIEVPKHAIRILSGSEEGLYGWITQQQLISQGFHFFNQKIGENKQGNILLPPGGTPIPSHHVGAIDFGGASTQITYWVPEKFYENPDYKTVPAIEGNPESLKGFIYTHSYLPYGIYESRYSTIDIVEQKYGVVDGVIDHPCLLEGSFAPHYNPASALQLRGTSDWEECKSLIRSLFRWDEKCLQVPCSFNGVHMPRFPDPHTILAFDYSAVIAGRFGFHGDTSLDELVAAIVDHCRMTWFDSNKNVSPSDQTVWKCYEGAYMIILFTEGYLFEEDKPHLVFTRELNTETVSWALGAVVAAQSPL